MEIYKKNEKNRKICSPPFILSSWHGPGSSNILSNRVLKFIITIQKFTTKTVTAPSKIRKEYQEIKTTGFAYDKEEYDEDVNAVAAPIFNHEDRVVAAVVIIAPSFRMSSSIETGSLELLKDTATDISDRLKKL